jgi:hypothetical protein
MMRTGTLICLLLTMSLPVLHFVEALLWGLLHRALPSHVGLSSFKEAVHFSLSPSRL